MNELTVLIGGEAGAGIMRSGSLLARAFMRGGLHVYSANDYQNLIRGGHNFFTVRAEEEEVHSLKDTVDVVLALNEETTHLHKGELIPGGAVVYDGEEFSMTPEKLGRTDLRLYSVPMMTIVRETHGEPVARNTVALGAAVALVDYDLSILENVIVDDFGKGKVADMNVSLARRGYEHIRANYPNDFQVKLKVQEEEPRILVTGTEAIGLGVARAGLKFYAAYPMTPASPLLHWIAANQADLGIAVVQAESEIAAMNMIIGASYAGVRSMTATSGGGFCLMTEALGLAGMSETPIVLMLGQRPGPSTGMPTYSSQTELRFLLHASQGEFPRIILAPGDVDECFEVGLQAHNLAEKYQVPVILLTDKNVLESHKSTRPFKTDGFQIERGPLLTGPWKETEDYKRYMLTESGVSPRAFPGAEGAIVKANSYEHDEWGYSSEEQGMTVWMNDKRWAKVEAIAEEMDRRGSVRVRGSEKPAVTIIGWGSTKGPILEAMKLLGCEGIPARYVQVFCLSPFPTERLRGALQGGGVLVLVENNKTAQLGSLIRENLMQGIPRKVLRYDGRPFLPGELAADLKEML
ncbi:MAG: 2-oxoacid:acceptor oxidoreductase subunit alpha [Candidatus Bathyarchaeia archaeon]